MLSEREGKGRDISNQLKEALDSTENANKVRETLKSWECMGLRTRLRTISTTLGTWCYTILIPRMLTPCLSLRKGAPSMSPLSQHYHKL